MDKKVAADILRRECDTWRALALAIRGKREVPADAIAVPYGKETRPMQLIMVLLVVTEIVAVHLLVPLPWLRWTLFVLGILSLLWVVGFVLASVVYPHTVNGNSLRIRCGSMLDVSVATENIAEMYWTPHMVSHSRSVTITDGALWIQLGGTAQVSVLLNEPHTIALPGKPPKRVQRLFFPADSREPVNRARALLEQNGGDPSEF